MYKMRGADGREYGPVSLDQLQQWISEGRINAQTLVQGPGVAEWKAASEFPELRFQSTTAPSTGSLPQPPPLPPPGPSGQQKGLAVTSFVLGLLSLVCFGPITSIPAIICGHVAHSRSRRMPVLYGGGGLAIAGFVMGYVGLFISLAIMPAMLLPALAKAKARAQSINCVNNMKQVGLAFRVWALDHKDQYPFNLSTNEGGTMEFSTLGKDGFELNAARHFQVLSNELVAPKILVCPGDVSKSAAINFQNLQSANVSYQLRSGPEINDTNIQAVLAVCPIHGHKLLCDGSVQQFKKGLRR